MLTVDRQLLLQGYLKDAEEAAHRCAMGQTVKVFVDQTGERVEYGPANLGTLNKYIYSLKVQLGIAVAGPAMPWM